MTTETYTDYPFTVNGVNFISRIFSTSELVEQISSMPKSIFATMNIQAVQSMIGDPSLLSTAELLEELERVNEGGTHAFILLGANS